MKIFFVPIEPFEHRYSAQWLRWFEREFKNHNFSYTTILPENRMSDSIREGEFLDVIGTNHFKAQQLQMLCELIDSSDITSDDVILIEDYWFPGIEMLAYMRDALKLNFKIAGILHAGTWDPNDYLTKCGMRSWGNYLENCWFSIADILFVATEYHKALINDKTNILVENKIKVTGFPIYMDLIEEGEFIADPIETVKSHKRIIFPHRHAPEKQSNVWQSIKKAVKDNKLFKDWEFVDTLQIDSKKEYYEMLQDSTIVYSLALQETWGIAQQEGVLLGCYPFVPDRLSYSELYPSLFKYSGREGVSVEQHVEALTFFILKLQENPDYFYQQFSNLRKGIILKGSTAIPKMLTYLTELFDED